MENYQKKPDNEDRDYIFPIEFDKLDALYIELQRQRDLDRIRQCTTKDNAKRSE
jgi:hypothetical protein